MAAFVLLTTVEGNFPRNWYVGLYTVKACLVTALLVLCRRVWRDIRLDWKVLPLAILVGIAVFFEWIYVDPLTPHPRFLGSREAFDPATLEPNIRLLFFCVRFYGLVLMVPLMEELFWRSFLIRWLTDPDHAKIPMGTFSWGAFAIVAGGFALAHPEWLAAIVCAAAYGLLLKQTKSLFACIVAHAVTNLSLGIYVLVYHKWLFW